MEEKSKCIDFSDIRPQTAYPKNMEVQQGDTCSFY